MPTVKERDGSNKLVILAKALIVFVQAASGYLINKYGANSPIGLLVTAILNLAPLLPAAEADALLYAADNSDVVDDPLAIPGIDETLPLPPEEPE